MMLCERIQVTGKAVMLDEIINYVQSLQRQVEVTTNNSSKVYENLGNLSVLGV